MRLFSTVSIGINKRERGFKASIRLIMSMRYQVHTTVSESRTLRAKVDALGKPLLAALITHGHPDHVAGLANLVEAAHVPIVALASVERMMRAIETPKRAQWGPIYGEE